MKWREKEMEVRSESGSHQRPEKISRTRLKVWFIRVCSSILLWTCLVQLVVVGQLWHPHFIGGLSERFLRVAQSPPLQVQNVASSLPVPPTSPQSAPPSLRFSSSPPTPSPPPLGPPSPLSPPPPPPSPPPLPPPTLPLPTKRDYVSNGFLRVTANGGLNQMRAAICDMVAVARLLNLTLVVPQLDKTSFWADTSDFADIFDVRHFTDSLRDEIKIIRRLPKKLIRKFGFQPLVMQPVSWSNENYYLQQVLPLFSKHQIIHFNKTDARLANNGLPLGMQKLRCRVNYQALKFTSKIEALGSKLIRILQGKGPFIALHLRYEMDMLAFSGCTHGCSEEEANELKRLRYAFPWWREKEINSEERRSQGLCPLTPEETSLVLLALGFDNKTQIYIASGEIYGGEHRLEALRSAFPHILKKEGLLDQDDLQQFGNHSSQMAALDFLVSVASDVFIPTYDGNMARLVEGHRRYLGFRRTISLNRQKIVELVDLHQNGTLPWDEFVVAIKEAHQNRTGDPILRKVIPDKPKEEDYFYSNPQECLCNNDTNCHPLVVHGPNSSYQG